MANKQIHWLACCLIALTVACGKTTPDHQGQTTIVDGNLVARSAKLWRNGQTLRIKFLDGSRRQKDLVKRVAIEWTRYANLNFEFVEDLKVGTPAYARNPKRDAEIRVTFRARGNNSFVGKDNLAFFKDQTRHTMSLSELSSDEIIAIRTILHEFGHVVGLEHEHQSPHANIRYNTDELYEFCLKEADFDKTTCERAIMRQLEESEAVGTSFDPHSIMGYWLSDSLYRNGSARTLPLATLSLRDKLGIIDLYPGRMTHARARSLQVEEDRAMVSYNDCRVLAGTEAGGNCRRDQFFVGRKTRSSQEHQPVDEKCMSSFYSAVSYMLYTGHCRKRGFSLFGN